MSPFRGSAFSGKKGYLLIALILFFSPVLTGASYSQASAQIYLEQHAENPWSTMALSVLGKTNIPTGYLKNISSDNAIGLASPILALTAVNKDPRSFGPEDYIAKLKTFYTQNQLGDPTLLNDDAFGILALISAGEKTDNEIILASKNFILQNQNQDGGWGIIVNSASNTNMTAAAIVSMVSAGTPDSDTAVTKALGYLQNSQNDDGGFPYDPKSKFGTESDSSSTAWVIWALNSLKIKPETWSKNNNNPVTYLESNQTSQGYFKFQNNSPEDSFSPITTAYAAIALAGKTLPINIISPAQPTRTFPFRIEGSSNTVCEGKAAGPTALDLIKNAKTVCGFTYNITQTAYGPYLDKINNDQAAGMSGWLYLINNSSPSVGAADYIMQTGDQALWYFGEFGWLPTRLTLDQTEIPEGGQAQANVEYFQDNSWLKLPQADVYAGTQNFQTDSSGTAQIKPNNGFYKIYAEKINFIRSNSKPLKIGNPANSAVNLSVNAIAGEVKGTTTLSSIAFTVEPGSLDFADLKPGQTSSKQISFSNIGTEGIKIAGQVSGDPVFTDTLQLDSRFWKNYTLGLTSAQDQNVQAKIAWPAGYQGGSGQKNGQIIFWASAE
jgi:hypothetical protein